VLPEFEVGPFGNHIEIVMAAGEGTTQFRPVVRSKNAIRHALGNNLVRFGTDQK